ncbi:MAG: beta-ketoacyl synthase chain length factor [Prevotella sp.]|nr:beta-ketoacyl synthase chain length factor [Prevotella sp.]MCI2080605.1 beta-ketoacyl synthase chain length factor [Prevotella sp.]MCI2102472.1 beta-ketoacyl synthase chain length factor [Prevotella sp.]
MENRVFMVSRVDHVDESEYRHYINPMKTRRYGRLLKRALVTAIKVIQDSGIEHPDAIINGTALGCLSESEKLLDALVEEGENASLPTHFMQSTHNTIASLIGIYTHTHGYNCTYSHRKISFESAFLDAFLQLKTGRIQTALVCANDEITDELREKIEALRLEGGIACDRSIAVMLCSGDYLIEKGISPMRELVDVQIVHHSDQDDEAFVITQEV